MRRICKISRAQNEKYLQRHSYYPRIYQQTSRRLISKTYQRHKDQTPQRSSKMENQHIDQYEKI